MSYDMKRIYQQYEDMKKKFASISLDKNRNEETNKLFAKKDVKNKCVNPFLVENNQNLEDETKILENQIFKKMKKSKIFISRKCFTVKEKILFKKDGTKVKFNLFRDEELGINQYDDKVKIQEFEDDYDSDDDSIMAAQGKTYEDLIEAFTKINENGYNYINNYKKYYK